jgi:tetratricopeptide (TPR) repeat protein
LGHLFGQRLGLLAVTVRDYLRMIVWPHPLRATYEDYAVHGLVLALLVHAGLLATVVLTRRRAPWLGLGIAFFYVALLPSSKLFAAPAVLAERFVYLPSAGLAILLAFGLRALWRRCGQRWPVLAAVVAVFSLAVLLPLTMRRNAEWRSVFSLWEAEARHGGDDWRMLHNVSTAYVEQGKFPQALAACQRGLRLAPDYRPLHTNCGVALQALERFAEANATLQRAVDLPGSGSRELGNLARFYVGRGRLAEADALFRRAIAAQQDPALRRLLVGERLLLVAGNAAAALPELEAAVQALPPHPRARRLLERARQEQAAGKGVSLPIN